MKPSILTIVGKSNNGKTTLVERLVAELTGRGYRIGTAKHTHCGFDIDKKGKDTWRHRQAGAVSTLMVTDDQAVLVKTDTRSDKEKLTLYHQDTDLVIAEGFKRLDLPRIEIFRTGSGHERPLFLEDKTRGISRLLAFVTDSDHQPGVPVFGLDEIDAIADFIETECIKGKTG